LGLLRSCESLPWRRELASRRDIVHWFELQGSARTSRHTGAITYCPREFRPPNGDLRENPGRLAERSRKLATRRRRVNSPRGA